MLITKKLKAEQINFKCTPAFFRRLHAKASKRRHSLGAEIMAACTRAWEHEQKEHEQKGEA